MKTFWKTVVVLVLFLCSYATAVITDEIGDHPGTGWASDTDADSDTDTDTDTDTDSDTDPCATEIGVYNTDFDSSNGGYTSTAQAPGSGNQKWEYGNVVGGPPSSRHGNVWEVGRGVGGFYSFCDNAFLTSPAVDLSKCDGKTITVTFEMWYLYNNNSSHGFIVEFFLGH